MANLLRTRKRRIEKKYEKLIGQKLKQMKDNTMGEFWAELDKLKQQMAEEFEKAGVKLEHSTSDLDSEDASGNGR